MPMMYRQGISPSGMPQGVLAQLVDVAVPEDYDDEKGIEVDLSSYFKEKIYFAICVTPCAKNWLIEQSEEGLNTYQDCKFVLRLYKNEKEMKGGNKAKNALQRDCLKILAFGK